MTAWQTLRVDEVASVFNGKTPSKSQQRDEGHPVLKIKDVDALGRFRGTFSGHVDIELAQKHPKQQLAGGETLVLNAAHSATHVASKTFYADHKVAGSLATGEWLVVRWNEETTDSRYGNHWINAAETRFRLCLLVNGIHLYPKDVARLKIPLPPLPEQKRIAAILDAADALRAKRRESLAQLDTLLQSTFLDLFGDPVANPMGWETKSLGELAAVKPNNGIFRKGPEYSECDDKGLPIVWVEELFRGNEINTRSSRRLDANPNEIEKYGLRHGDILFCRSSLKLDGIAYNNVFLGKTNEALFECHLIRVSPNIEIASPVFLNLQLRSIPMRALLKSKSKTATMTTIDQKALSSVVVVVPPLDLQHRFATIVESIEQQKARYRAHLAELNTLFASLQARAFNGDL